MWFRLLMTSEINQIRCENTNLSLFLEVTAIFIKLKIEGLTLFRCTNNAIIL